MAQVAIVMNPTKFRDLTAVRRSVARACARHGWPDAVWYETTAADPGTGQARRALEDGATLVCSLGGDGTVRAVAEALAGDDVPLGLLPGGTGNLLARNLRLPLGNLDDALDVALAGADRLIDVGRVRFDEGPESVFLVMIGMGLDAQTVGADEGAKKRLGHLAYVLAGLRALAGPGFRLVLEGDGTACRQRHARAVVVGNCGELTGGVALLPDAAVDDGALDVVVVSPRGIVGWSAVLFDILTRHHRGHPALQRFTGASFTARTAKPVEAEIDGDVTGPRSRLAVRIQPCALRVRVPAPRTA